MATSKTSTYESKIADTSLSAASPFSLSTQPTATTTKTATPTAPKTTTTTPKTTVAQPTISTAFNQDAFQQQLAKIKAEALRIQGEVSKLNDDQKSSDMEGVVSSSDSAVNNERNILNELGQASADNNDDSDARKASKDYQKFLDQQIANVEAQLTGDLAGINKQFDDTKTSTITEQGKETGTTTVALQRIGGYLGGSASGLGAMLNLAQNHRNELTTLEGKRTAALQEARNAANAKRFKFVELKLKEAKDIEQEIYTRRNKFFDDNMKLIAENRAQEKSAFDRATSIIDRTAPTVVAAISGMDNQQDMVNYIRSFAADQKVDPDLLLGEVNKLYAERQKIETGEVSKLSAKYVDAGINSSDTLESATEKVRTNSQTYKLDIRAAEASIANSWSLVNDREGAASIDYSDPVLALYTQATGKVANTPNEARAILGYSDAILGDKEIIDDEDATGELTDNQIKASDAQKILSDAFTKLNKSDTEIPSSMVWQWLSTPEAQEMSDDEKASYIMGAGHDPYDFGY